MVGRLVTLLIFIGMASACTRSFQPPKNTLVAALASQPATLDPRFATDAAGTRIGDLIFSGFVRIGNDFQVEPDAAESWSFKNKTYTFYLRPDLRFHNGRALTREDLLYTWDFYRSPASPFATGLKNVKSVDVKEENGRWRVDIELHQQTDKFLIGDLPVVKILPKDEVEKAGADFSQVLIGTGPFRFVRQNLNEIRLQSVNAKIDHLVFKIVRDDFTRYQKMLKGELDIAQNELPPERIAEFQKHPDRFKIYTYPGLNMTYLLINLRDPVLKRKNVRLAFAQTINREEIIRYKLHGFASPATSILTPNNYYHNSAIRNPPLNREAARRLIEEAKATGHQLILKTANTPAAIDIGRVLANQLGESGVRIKHESYEWATYYDDVKKGNFQLATMKWVGIVDPDIYRAAFHSDEMPPGRNRGGYVNPKVDRLLDLGLNEPDRVKRKRLFDEVQAIVHSDLVIIPLWYDVQVAVVRSTVTGYEPVMTSDYWPFTKLSKSR